MSRIISLQEAARRRAKNSLRAYLEGEKNLKWIIGVLEGIDKAEIKSFLDSFGQRGLTERRKELNDWLAQQ